ncbi:hypothetical protein [Larkinella terrae]|uniref:Uncharacterized protein n=1 Tax=Larkinella terrae TaxID=2025311 RepID=A0A7K0EIV3_9BACT|nr:hypothetical protein [Larkinella terrae]MRS61790.1 hypothetical protein [Larkinella terrae]
MKVNTNSPTAEDLAMIKATQERCWQEVNAKEKWTDEDFQDALFCHCEWKEQKSDFFYSMISLEKLAFDPRTPEVEAQKLLTMLNQMKESPQDYLQP